MNSHMAIMARTHEIPSSVGVNKITQNIKQNDVVAINGKTGEIFVNPSKKEYKNFEELLFKQGFKYQFPSEGAFYCKNDVSISSVESESNQAVGEGAARKYWVCGRISFTYSWQKDKNDTNYSCPRIID